MATKLSNETYVHYHGNISEQVKKVTQPKKKLPVLDTICIQAVAAHIHGHRNYETKSAQWADSVKKVGFMILVCPLIQEPQAVEATNTN